MTKRIIKTRKIRKALAVVMIASLCMSQLTVGSFGAEISTDTVPTPAGDVEVTVTTEITTTETRENNGNTTQTTVTTETWTSEAEVTNPEDNATDEETTVEPENPAGEPAVDPETDPTTDPAGEEGQEATPDPNVETDVTVTGQETFTETTKTDSQSRVIYESEQLNGNEQIDINTTTTTVGDPQEEVLIDDTTTDPEIVNDYTVEKGDPTTTTEEGTWDNGTPEAAGDWNETDSSTATKTTTTDPSTHNIDIADPLDSEDVTLTLVQNKNNGEDKEERQSITFTQLEAGEIEGIKLQNGVPTVENARVETTNSNGDKVVTTYEVRKTTNGYEIIKNVTTETVTSSTGTPTAPKETGSSNIIGSGAVTPTLDADLNDILTNGEDAANDNGEAIKTKTETSKNAEGNDVSVKTDIREIKDANGKVIGYEVTKTTTTTRIDGTTNDSTSPTTTSDNPVPADEFTLPAKPAASDVTSETGERTVVTVEEVKDANGTVVGYKSLKVEYDAKGNETMRSSETVYGTTKKYRNTTETDPTFETVTTTTTVVETEVTTYAAEQLTRETDMTSTRVDSVTTTEVTDTTKYQLVTTDQGTYFIGSVK